MSITFACPECGKSFTLDDKFGGKKGRCKQCGAIMPIPAASAPGRALGRETSPPRRSSRPAADVYGFDDEPLPPRSMTPESDDIGLDAPAPRAPLYPKRAGLYPEPTPRSSSGGGLGAVKIIVRVVLVITGGLGALIGSAVGIPGIRSLVTPGGWSTRSQIESFVKRQVDLTEELTGILRTVSDVPTASERSSRANETVRKMIENLTSNKDRRGNQKDIEDIKRKYLFDQQQALQSFTGELQRLGAMPGVLEALAVEESLMELAAIEETIPGISQQAGLNPTSNPLLNFRAPRAPTFRPVAIPGLNPPGPGLNLQPPGLGGPISGPGPQGPSFRPPNMPGPPAMPPRPNFPGLRGRNRAGGRGPV